MKNARVLGTLMAVACVVAASRGGVLAQEKPGWTPISKEKVPVRQVLTITDASSRA